MLEFSKTELEKLGAINTTTEIKQQPRLWRATFEDFLSQEEAIDLFLNNIKETTAGKVRVIFTGAGSSAYAGDTATPYLNRNGDKKFTYESVPTTDIVGSPLDYLRADDVTILVSFGRSGNSPESIAAVEKANQLVENIYHIIITCDENGQLAKIAKGATNTLLLVTEKESNDLGFAMTSSFTCMLLTALLIFDATKIEDKKLYIETAATLGEDILGREAELAEIVARDFNRIIYLGTGTLAGLTREAQLKILELTAGKIATVFDSSMGFRHGPKSFIDEKTLVFDFVNNDTYSRQYDLDMLNEMKQDDIANSVIAIAQPKEGQDYTGETIQLLAGLPLIPEAYAVFPNVIVAQIIALLTSVKIGNTPDTPSATGTVNRVVKGVTIHEFSK